MGNIKNDIYVIVGFAGSTAGKIANELNMELVNDVLYSGVLLVTMIYTVYKIRNEIKKK
jgi:hypothetical protein